MEVIYRRCPICGSGQVRKMQLPESFQGERPEWFGYTCSVCGTQFLVQPFIYIKDVVKG